MSTALLKPLEPGIDEYRWLRVKHGNVPLDEIARVDGVSVKAVERSILKVERQRAKLTLREIHAAEVGVLLTGVKDEVQAINSALRATKRVQVLDVRGRALVENGEPVWVEVPDHETRLAAVKTRTDILNAVQPKGGGFNFQVNQQVAVAGAVSKRGVESRIIDFYNARQNGLQAAPEEADEDAEADEL